MEDNENTIYEGYFPEPNNENENKTLENILNINSELNQQPSGVKNIMSSLMSSLKTFEELLNDIKIPYPNKDEIPLIKIKDENQFKNGNDIDTYNKSLSKFDNNKYDNKFNICRQCKKEKNINKYFCQNCNQNICENCSKNCISNNHKLIDLKGYLEEFEENKMNIYLIISNFVLPKEEQSFESNNNKNENIPMKNTNDIILILALCKQTYNNYFHYINIKECLYYLRNKYKDNIGYIIINYNISENESKIKIFGNKFVMKNKNNCHIIYEDNNYNLMEYFELKNIGKNKILEIKLIGMNNIIDASYMFSGCKSLNSLPDITKWNTINVKDMSFMFSWCISLNSLPNISNWNTNNVTNMSGMFWGCKSLISLPDISKWNIDNVSDMSYMFSLCESLTSLPDLSKLNTINVSDMSCMFEGCKSLISLPDISKWNKKNLKYMNNMFYECKSLNSLPDIKIPYPDNDEIPLLKIKDENYFENDKSIEKYVKSLVEFDDNKFNICRYCKEGGNKFFCNICYKNICNRNCYEKCKSKNHTLIELKDNLKEVEENKNDIKQLISKYFILSKEKHCSEGTKKKKKSNEIMNEVEKNKEIEERQIKNDNDILLIEAIIEKNNIISFYFIYLSRFTFLISFL